MVSIAQLLDIQAENTKSQVLFACTPNEHGPQPDVAAVKGIVAALVAVAGRRGREHLFVHSGPAERQLMKEKVA